MTMTFTETFPTAVAPAVPARPVFAGLQARWLLLAVAMVFPVWWITDYLYNAFGIALPEILVAIIAYLPEIAWLVWAVTTRRLNLPAMLSRPRLGWYWLVVLGLGVSLWFVSAATILVSDILFPIPAEDSAAMAAAMTDSPLLLAVISLVVLPPIVEELVFRGALFERWTIRWRAGVALLVSAGVFGVLHADMIGAAVFGLVMGLLYLRTRSLLPGMLVHALNNGAVLLLMRLPQDAAGADYPAPSWADLPEALTYLAIGAPLVVWFVITNWPRVTTTTPYEQYEAASGVVPTRTLPGVVAIDSSGRALPAQRLTVTGTELILRKPKSWNLTRIPLAGISHAYQARTPRGELAIVVRTDGTWLGLSPTWYSGASPADLAILINQRTTAALAGTRPEPALTGA